MKTPYEELDLELVRFTAEDVLTTSAVDCKEDGGCKEDDGCKDDNGGCKENCDGDCGSYCGGHCDGYCGGHCEHLSCDGDGVCAYGDDCPDDA